MLFRNWARRASAALSLLGIVSTVAVGCGESRDGTAPDRQNDAGAAGDSASGAVAGGSGAGAGGTQEPAPTPGTCSPLTTHEPIPQRGGSAKEERLDTFANLAGQLEIQCGNCHEQPAEQGAFSFTGSAADLCQVRGTGSKAKGETVADVMLSGYMPFMVGGQQALGLKAKAWLDQGCPADVFRLPGQGEAIAGSFSVSPAVGDALTDLGNCSPEPALAGADAALDARFSRISSFADLPSALTDTDFVSLDSRELAARGTFAYSPTYPLWSDDARKLRYVHVPAGRAISLNRATQQFAIPDNTRFYKTFLREVKSSTGESRWRKLETRLIVTRASGDAIYGTYLWNSNETGAKLLGTGLDPASPAEAEVNLNGQPFPDFVETFAADESKPEQRTSYAVPGAQRCVSCHTGSGSGDFILGFTPLQLKHREAGTGGVIDPVLPDELGQIPRLTSYGVLRAVNEADVIDLEDTALPRKPRTIDELNLQAYLLGNCAHCHNPKGSAVQNSSGLAWLDLSAGGAVFGFDFSGETGGPRELDGSSFYFSRLGIDPTGVTPNLGPTLYASGFLRRVLAPTQLLTPRDFSDDLAENLGDPDNESLTHINLHMPLHTSGIDCRLPRLAARWWASVPRTNDGYEQLDPSKADPKAATAAANVAEQWVDAQCRRFESSMKWVIEDESERYPYVERNIDWRSSDDPENIPPPWLKALSITPAHEALAKKPYSLGYFHEGCEFPTDAAPPESIEPWMLNYTTGEPDHPWSQIYRVNPGEVVYSSICASCHGYRGDAQTGAARLIRYTSGARVASFVDGLFGPRAAPGASLSAFDELTSNGPEDKPSAALGTNGAAKYVVWMAYRGTHASFGRTQAEESEFLKRYVSLRAASAAAIPLRREDATAAQFEARANMLQLAGQICDHLRRPALAPGEPALTFDAATQSGASARNQLWRRALDVADGNPFGTPVWRDICTLDNPLTEEVATDDAGTEAVQAWLDRAVFNAGAMAYIYLRDELTRGVYAPNYDQCALRYPQGASHTLP